MDILALGRKKLYLGRGKHIEPRNGHAWVGTRKLIIFYFIHISHVSGQFCKPLNSTSNSILEKIEVILMSIVHLKNNIVMD